MREFDSIARELKIVINKSNRMAQGVLPADIRREVTRMQGRVIGFLYRNGGRDVFQRDVEAEFSITRATASKMLSRMERNGLIVRSGVAGDARLKKLELTDKAVGYFQQILQGFQQFEQRLTRGLTEEEGKALLRLLRKLEANLSDMKP
jgi:DNA-binding MarR family transcriptional regulator